MGLRYRKSIKMPLGFRINLSKSGIGYSYGFKGYRHTVMANGRTRDTLSIPGTGISYVKEHSRNNQSNENNFDTPAYTENNTDVKTLQYINMVNSSYESIDHELYRLVQQTISRDKAIKIISNILIGVFITLFIISSVLNNSYTVSILMLGILCMTISLILKMYKAYCRKNKIVNISYTLDEYTSKEYELLYKKWQLVGNNKMIWNIINMADVRRRTNAGATSSVTRKIVNMHCELPWFIDSNIKPICVNMTDTKMFLFPDRILFIQGELIKFIDYDGIKSSFSYSNFAESGTVAPDANIVDTSWLYVNKDGSRDKRFNNNRKIPICKYGVVALSSNQLNLIFMVSNYRTIELLQESCKDISDMVMTSKNKECNYDISI